jgi:M6 family metalloprotease-like protein
MKIDLLSLLSVVLLCSCTVTTFPIPELDSKGDIYKTEGKNDELIYSSTVGKKKTIMLYVDFPDAEMKESSQQRMKKVLGEGKFEEIFTEQSYGKVSFDIQQVHGWRRLPKSHKKYSSKTTESHRDLFAAIFALYPEINFLNYDYIMANMPRIGNTAFGERESIAIPYKGTKIKVALNISSANPYVLAHETGHLMGLPDIYTYGGVKGPKNPAGQWDIMSNAHSATGFIGWHRHKLKWLDDDRKAYLTKGKHRLRLTALNADSGISMIVVPTDDPLQPSKVFVVEVAQAVRLKGGATTAAGVLVYSVDATLASGRNPLAVYPKKTLKKAPFLSGDTFSHDEAPMSMKVLAINKDLSYTVEVEIK